MKALKIAVLGTVGVAIASALLVRKAEPRASMHEHDWDEGQVCAQGRRYRSLGQFIHHQRELVTMAGLVARIYLAGAIAPGFREQIMIVTALSNDCGT